MDDITSVGIHFIKLQYMEFVLRDMGNIKGVKSV